MMLGLELWTVAASLLLPAPSGSTQQPPNVVYILLDDAGWGDDEAAEEAGEDI